MKEQIEKIKQNAINELNQVLSLDNLSQLETKYLGRKGELTKILRQLVDLQTEAKQEIGQLANTIKLELTDRFNKMRNKFEEADQAKSFIDVTLPGTRPRAVIYIPLV